MKSLVKLQSIKNLLSARVIKTILVLFVFVSMMINIVAPRNIENKEQIMSVICLVFNNVVVKTIVGCKDTLLVISNKMAKDLYKLLTSEEEKTDVPVKSEQENETPANTSSDSGIEIGSRDYKELLRYALEEGLIVLTIGKVDERLYRLYGNIKVYCSQISGIWILFFIMFIVVIRKRKEDVEEQIHSIWKDKTNLCLK